MLTQAEILTALSEELGDANSLLSTTAAIRWFNEGQARLEWYTRGVLDVTWNAGDIFVGFAEPIVGVEEILYPSDAQETRWRETQGGIVIEDHDGAQYAGTAKLLVRAYWPDVDGSTSSSLPRLGDSACLSYALHRFYRKLCADRALFQRYSTLIGENGVSIDDLGDLADDHYRDFLDLRNDLPVEAPAAFFGG